MFGLGLKAKIWVLTLIWLPKFRSQLADFEAKIINISLVLVSRVILVSRIWSQSQRPGLVLHHCLTHRQQLQQ